MNKFLATAIVGAVCLSAAPAAALTTFTWNAADIGTSAPVVFNGLVEGVPLGGLSAQIDFTLLSVSGNAWTFQYDVDNTSGAPVTASRVSVFGFQVTPNVDTSTSTGLFDIAVVGNNNIPGLPFNAEACYKGGGGAGNCAGGGGDGVAMGDPNAIGTFTLNFGGPTGSVTLENFFVRYQSIDAPGIQGGSGVGTGTVVPEPATWAMMIVGFGLAGTMIRTARRRHYLTA